MGLAMGWQGFDMIVKWRRGTDRRKHSCPPKNHCRLIDDFYLGDPNNHPKNPFQLRRVSQSQSALLSRTRKLQKHPSMSLLLSLTMRMILKLCRVLVVIKCHAELQASAPRKTQYPSTSAKGVARDARVVGPGQIIDQEDTSIQARR